MEKEVLLIDCDGVLFPETCLPITEINQAIRETATKRGYQHKDLVDAKNRAVQNHEIGLFNVVWELVNKNINVYEDFCTEAFSLINYSRISKNEKLLELLKHISQYYDIYIATNNHYLHVKNVISKLFELDLNEQSFINVIDITKTLHNGCFHPKQSFEGLEIYAKLAKSIPQKCILLDDNAVNVTRANEIKMRSYQITLVANLEFTLKELLVSHMSKKS